MDEINFISISKKCFYDIKKTLAIIINSELFKNSSKKFIANDKQVAFTRPQIYREDGWPKCWYI